MKKFNIKINGKDIELENVSTVKEMIEQRNVTGTMFVVEKNKEIVAKENYTKTSVNENDVFEIVGFFGGG
jgi:sulfur carrier protein